MLDRARDVLGRARDVLGDRRVRRGAAALVVVVVLLGVGALWGGWRPFERSVDVVAFGPDGDVDQFTLFQGQCATGALGATRGFGTDTDTPCGEPHDIEVVATRAPLDEGRPVSYPGRAAMVDFGRAYCRVVVASETVASEADGVSKDDLTVTALVPGQAAFDAPRSGDASSSGARQVACVVSRSDGGKLADRFSVI